MPMESSVVVKIKELIEGLRPKLAMHAGDIAFVDFLPESGIVQVRLSGTCRGCPLSSLTLKMGVEHTLMEALPGIVLGVEEVG